MFDGVARRYDLTNTVLSSAWTGAGGGAPASACSWSAAHRVLDLAAGTGVSTVELRRGGAHAVGVRLLARHAARRPGAPAPAPTAVRRRRRDLHLPFADDAFDAAVISFGLRNVVRRAGRAARDGAGRPARRAAGHLRVQPADVAPFRYVYLNYLMRALPWLARRVSSNAEAYVYLAESIRAWPAQDELAAHRRRRRMDAVRHRNLTGGIVALHMAERPRVEALRLDPRAQGSVAAP